MQLSIVLIIVSVLTFFFVVSKIRKNGLNIDDSIIWILWAITLLVLSIFPQVATFFSQEFGFQSTSNFVLSVFIFALYLIIFMQAVQISKLKNKLTQLVQKVSIKDVKEYEEDHQ